MKDRLNRCRIEWKPFFTPAEYILLDQILYRSNLTEANNGQGFIFHVRQLAKETRLSLGIISQKCKQWPFMIKKGTSKAMTIQLDYKALELFIVHSVNNDCSLSEPISKKEEVRDNINKNKGIVHSVNNNKSDNVGANVVSMEPHGQCFNVPAGAETQKPIVHSVNNNKSIGLTDAEKEGLKAKGLSDAEIYKLENNALTELSFRTPRNAMRKTGFDSFDS
jgi:hypothetical protein